MVYIFRKKHYTSSWYDPALFPDINKRYPRQTEAVMNSEQDELNVRIFRPVNRIVNSPIRNIHQIQLLCRCFLPAPPWYLDGNVTVLYCYRDFPEKKPFLYAGSVHGNVSIQVSGSCLFDKVLHRSHIAPGFDLRSVLPVKKWIFFFRQAATAFPLQMREYTVSFRLWNHG